MGQLQETTKCRKHISSKEKTICVSLKLRKEVNVDRKKQIQQEVVERNDESSKPSSESVSSAAITFGCTTGKNKL